MQRPLNLVLLGDSCSGVPGHPHERNFRAVAEALRRRAPSADALCYLGDHVAGYVADEDELRAQWAWFLAQEFPPIAAAAPQVFHIPGNHDCYDSVSSGIYGELLPVAHHRTLVAEKDLNYAVRLDEALLVFLNTADAANRGAAMLDLAWLRAVLADHAEAEPKLVFGHHPILPVNGYDEAFRWRVEPTAGELAWSTMRESGVRAYLCSHIIAFDFQVRDGLPQLCSGGAGTEYGPMGAMPGPVEYQHFLTLEVGARQASFQVFDKTGVCRESLSWPPALAAPDETLALTTGSEARSRQLATAAEGRTVQTLRWRIDAPASNLPHRHFAISGTDDPAGRPSCTIEPDADDGRIRIAVTSPESKETLVWRGPALPAKEACTLDIAIHPHAGPGAVLGRLDDRGWSSFASSSPSGLASMRWPALWSLRGDGQPRVAFEVFAEGPPHPDSGPPEAA